MALTCLVLLFLLPLFRVTWPKRPIDYLHLSFVGILVHGVYLGGVFAAIHHGLPASVAAIIVGLQPLVTVFFAMTCLKETLSIVKLCGLMIGLLGVFMVLGEGGLGDRQVNVIGIILSTASLIAISAGTVYQKKFCETLDLLPGIFVQYFANTVFMAVLAFSLETRTVHWNLQFILALGWLIFCLSIGAVLLLMWLIRQGKANRVASLFYLVPPLVTIEAWFLFGERFGTIALIGMICCGVGVAMVLKEKHPGNPEQQYARKSS